VDSELPSLRVKKDLAIAALACGMASVILFPLLVFGPLAASLGAIALVKASRRPQEVGGKGFAIAGLAIGGVMTVASLLVLAMVAPGVLDAPGRGRQKRTMSDMRSLATAWEAYAIDNKTYCPIGGSYVDLRWGNLSPRELQSMLSPMYLREMPVQDAWQHDFEFAVMCRSVEDQDYRIRSRGADGKRDDSEYVPGTPTSSFSRDIVFGGGRFLQWPEGPQRR